MIVRRVILLLIALFACGAPAQAQDKRIALTFDDVPRQPGAFLTPDQRTRRLIAALKAAGVRQAAFFVIPGNVGKPDRGNGERHIAAYVAAGHVIADHSFAHPALRATRADAYLAGIDRSQAWLKGRPGYRPWFRFPYLDEGGKDKAKRDAVRAGLAARGLLNAYVTTDGSDWNFEMLAVQAKAAGKRIDRAALRDLYVETLVGAAEYYDGLARQTLGRSPAHVMLMHETDLAALWLPDLVRALRAKGWTIVTADAAFADPIARLAPDTPSANGTRTEMLAWEKGLPAPRWYDRDDPEIGARLFRQRVLHEAAP